MTRSLPRITCLSRSHHKILYRKRTVCVNRDFKNSKTERRQNMSLSQVSKGSRPKIRRPLIQSAAPRTAPTTEIPVGPVYLIRSSRYFSCVLLWFAALTMAEPAKSDEIDFNRDIKPILSNRCYFCHGPDESERQGGLDGLRLDTREGALEDLGGHAAIVAGEPQASELLTRVLADDAAVVMPPPGMGAKLTVAETELLTRWIRQGAPYSPHWSYVPPERPSLPVVTRPHWPRNPVDHFVLERLERFGMQPSEAAGRYALVRRLHLDLTGLPPTIAEVDAFVTDPSDEAYEKRVDELLSRMTYGEHWARIWLDLARYADSAGYADDPPRTIWLYRDWVIQAINDNLPFDQFTIQQLAGDLLPDPSDQQLIATAFHRNTMTNNEGGTNDEEFRNAAVIDRVNTTFAVWMGTTLACAQCHTHKYDPLTQEEYFKVFAILNNTADADRRDESPLLQVLTPQQRQRREELELELAVVRKQLQTDTPKVQAARAAWDAGFPRNWDWVPLQAESFQAQADAVATFTDELIEVTNSGAQDSYVVKLRVPAELRKLRGLALETLPAASLPGGGAGHGEGNFVISRVAAQVVPADDQRVLGRYVRITIPGKQKILSLAEVQVFDGMENIALAGKASQSSTAFAGPAHLAIDGNTDGDYGLAQSTTHTAISDSPWWELDLRASATLDRIRIWNRTDGNVGERLKDFQVALLDDDRQVVWQQTIRQPPAVFLDLPVDGQVSIDWQVAVADFHEAGFDPASLLFPADSDPHGWSVGGAVQQTHRLTLISQQAVDLPNDGFLTVTIGQQSRRSGHTLGRFRLLGTDDPSVSRWSQAPAEILAVLNIAPERRTEAQRQQLAAHYRENAPELAEMRQRITDLERELSAIKPTTVPIMRELPTDQQRITRLQHRGNFLALGDPVSPGTPAVFHPLAEAQQADRLALAKWLVDPANPLTARVVANRYWETLFGTGIVATSEEFGSQGELPTHPELLDWLATELMRMGWDTKAFVKLLVMSATYRQSSRVTADMLQRDPDNRLLSRGPRFRMSAEMIRDSALAVAGLLSDKMFGPPVRPPQPATELKAAFGSGIDWQTSTGEDRYRRGLYTMWRRSNPYPSMVTFDAPNREVCTLRRGRSNTPLQALVTLNDPVYIEAAQALGRRIVSEADGDLPARLKYGFRLCLARPPSASELTRLEELYQASLQHLREDTAAAEKLATDPLGPISPGRDVHELAAWTAIANVLLNLDETLMRP